MVVVAGVVLVSATLAYSMTNQALGSALVQPAQCRRDAALPRLRCLGLLDGELSWPISTSVQARPATLCRKAVLSQDATLALHQP